MADDARKELEELRRLEELESKAAVTSGKPRTYKGAPSDPVVQERAKSLAEKAGEYLFDIPSREDFSLGEVAGAGGVGAGIMAAAPKALEYGGKLVSAVPTGPLTPLSKGLGLAMQAGGQALGKAPLVSRAVTGAAGGAIGAATEQVGEMMGVPRAITLPVSFVTSGMGGYVGDRLMRSLGLEGKAISKDLAKQGVQISQDMLEKAGLTKSEAQREMVRLQGIQQQLAGREKTVIERARNQPLTPEESLNVQLQNTRQRIANEAASERGRASLAVQQAGLDAENAAKVVNEAEQNVVKANQAVDALEQQMLQMPQMNKEQFGKQLQSTTQKLFDDGNTARKTASGFKKIEDAAGDAPSVSTSGINLTIDELIKKTGNPTTRNVLQTIKAELKTKPQGVIIDSQGRVLDTGTQGVSLARASSLKGYLDSIINSKQMGDLKLDKEVLKVVRDVKSELIGSINQSHPEWVQALGTFRTMSRPLDIVERNGALAKVIDKDPLSTEYKMMEAQVVGNAIEKAKAGNKVFQRLIEKNPDIKESARLYFTKELFGKEAAPTEAGLRTFLKNNESVLKQIGIFDDFRNLRIARTTAEDAVKIAKGEVGIAKEGLTAAKKAESEAKQFYGSRQTKADIAQKRLSEGLQTAEPLEKMLARSKASVRPYETKIGQQVKGAEKTIEQQTAIQKEFNTLINDLTGPQRISPREVPKRIEALAERLLKDDIINQAEKDLMVNESRRATSEFESADAARKRLYQIGAAIAGLGVAGGVLKGGSDTITYR